MLFTLEALQAKHGDALLLHYGTAASPKLVVIDGGPGGVYNASLRPRLEELRADPRWGDPLPIRMLMVSHIDDDHINGVLALTNDLVDFMDDAEALPYEIDTLWHNSFDDLVKRATGTSVDALAAAAATVPKTGSVPASLGGMRFESALLAASVPQGRKLRDNAARLQLAVNEKFDTLVSAPDKGKKVSLGNNLELVVLGPNQERLDALEKDWRAKVKAAKKAKKTKPADFMRLTADFVDESVYNLSSIVVLASSGGKRMLLTGDARGDDLLKAVKKAGLMKNGVLHVEVLKVPHHGSDRNVSTEFFRQITADRYVISADGRHGNPDVAMLKMLTEAREDDGDPYEIFLTNKVAKVDTLLKKEKTAGKKLTVVYRPTNGTLLVELGEPLPA